MRTIRLYSPEDLVVGQSRELDATASHHLCTVLRQSSGNELVLFNGREDAEYLARLKTPHKRKAVVDILERRDVLNESPLNIHLYQGVSRGDRMDFAIQKATELGVGSITPVLCQRSQVRLSGEKAAKKVQHWQQVATSAAQQCGRCRIPEVFLPVSFSAAIAERPVGSVGIFLHTREARSVSTDWTDVRTVDIWIGPEGGFEQGEVKQAVEADLSPMQLGPRVLRTETATVAAITACQLLAGDFSH
ncbi:MAG: 16S rRNA (uracil(1498)-N(3))-methyltransferase [Pseudomonadota bacterium]